MNGQPEIDTATARAAARREASRALLEAASAIRAAHLILRPHRAMLEAFEQECLMLTGLEGNGLYLPLQFAETAPGNASSDQKGLANLRIAAQAACIFINKLDLMQPQLPLPATTDFACPETLRKARAL